MACIRVPGSSGIYSGGWPVVQGVTNIIESDTRASNSEDQEDDSLFFFFFFQLQYVHKCGGTMNGIFPGERQQ